MILDLGSFMRKGFLVDRVCPADTWGRGCGAKHGAGRGFKIRKDAEENGETTDLSAMVQ